MAESENPNPATAASEPTNPNGGGAPAGGAPIGQPDAQPPAAQEPAKTFTQEQVDVIVKERVEREKTKAAKATEDARKAAELEAAAKNGEWEKVAKERETEIAAITARLAELDTTKATLADYESRIKTQLEKSREGLPAHITELLDGMPTLQQLDWITKNRDALGGGQPPPTKPIPGTPRPASGKELTEAETKQRQKELGAQLRSMV